MCVLCVGMGGCTGARANPRRDLETVRTNKRKIPRRSVYDPCAGEEKCICLTRAARERREASVRPRPARTSVPAAIETYWRVTRPARFVPVCGFGSRRTFAIGFSVVFRRCDGGFIYPPENYAPPGVPRNS